MNQNPFDMDDIRAHFHFDGSYIDFAPINNGHINHTYVINFEQEDGAVKQYLLQRINTNVFQNPDELMENILRVTSYLRDIIVKSGGDPERETLHVILTADRKPYYRNARGECWRCYNFITNAYTCQQIDDPQVFASAGRAFGDFQRQLADYPSGSLHETIPDFHNTVVRFQTLKDAIARNSSDRADRVQPEIDFALSRERDAHVLVDLLRDGKLPLRVTHNDTKLNNVMFDNDTKRGICVIDLDTVMPGLSLYDFGDSIRYGANHAAEDEKDLSQVYLDLHLFEQYVCGYLESAGKSLTSTEIEYLPFSAKLMTFECGIRFLTDYLDGDTYFQTAYPDHNLDRCRTQLALVADIEKKMEQMKQIIASVMSSL